jgi:hypothetical protein
LSLEEANETLDFVQFYAVWHFEREEACFAGSGEVLTDKS